MTDYRDYWIVRLGDLYFGGLGAIFSNPACTGWVLTRIREHAEHFTDLATARTVARAISGQVCKVMPPQKIGPPCGNRNGPGSNEP